MLGRENFSFDSKIIIGEFIERRQGESGDVRIWCYRFCSLLNNFSFWEFQGVLSEADVSGRINELRKLHRIKKLNKEFNESNELDKNHRDALAKLASLYQEQQQLLQDMPERGRPLISREAKKPRVDDLRRSKENERIMKEQERFERLEIARLEKVAKAQQLEEVSVVLFFFRFYYLFIIYQARRKRREELERQRQEEIIRKNQVKITFIFVL